MAAKSKAPTPTTPPQTTEVVEQRKDETDGQAMARVLLNPDVRHGHAASCFSEKILGGAVPKPGLMDYAAMMKAESAKAAEGDMASATRLLTSQAFTLDAMFTEFARRSSLNMGEHLGAAETYARLAMKAQANSRATLEALAKLHQPREQTVRHVHVNDGGQAVIADEVHHHHGGGKENANSDDQSHAAGATGAADAIGGGSALPSPDAFGQAMPIACDPREAALQDARRDQSGAAAG